MKIVIAGAGEVGSYLAEVLSGDGHDISVIDSDPDRIDRISSTADIVAVEGNPSSIDTLKKSGISNADLFIAVYPSESQDINVVSAILAKKLGAKQVSARVNHEEYLSYDSRYIFTEMGIDLLFYPEKIAANEIVELLNHSSASNMVDFARGMLQMVVFNLDENSPVIDTSLKDFAESNSSLSDEFRIVAVSRDEQTIIPSFDYRFKYRDRLFIIATREAISSITQIVGKSNLEVKNVIMMGGSHTGEMVARILAGTMDNLKIIDNDRDRCGILSETLPSNVQIINGDARNTNLLIDEDIRNCDAFIALTESAETNILACVAAKKLGVSRTIAKVENLEYIPLAEGMGVDAIVNKKLITASRILKFTLSDKVRSVKYMGGTSAEIIEFTVVPGSRITKAPLKELDFPRNAIIGGVIRGSESFIAVGATQIQAYDRVAVFALSESVQEVDRWFK